MKILVATGTTEEYNFDRLFRILDELCDEKIIDALELTVQGEAKKYQPRNYKAIKMFTNEKFTKLMEEADCIISHAGTGTVVTALKKEKRVIIFPRQQEYGELLDNYQSELCNIFQENQYVLSAKNKEELSRRLLEIERAELKKFESNSENFRNELVRIIKNYEYESKNKKKN